MSVKLVTFDLDNTLWDVTPALHRAEAAQNEWLRSHRPDALRALDAAALNALRKTVWQDHAELRHDVTALRKLVLKAMQIAAGYSERDAAAGAEAAFTVFLAERQRVELYAGARETLDMLAADYRIGALTNGNADVFKTAAGPFFEFAFQAGSVGSSKPAAEMFRAALDLAGLPAKEAVHVGDSVDHDIRGAQAVGMRTVWINPEGLPWPGKDRPDAEARTVRELPALLAEISARS